MYCHLCRVDGSPSHETSSWHRSAKELAAVAVDRLSDYLTAAIDGDPSTPGFVERFLDSFISLEKTPATEESTKTQRLDQAFCDSCNLTVPVTDWKNHQRQKEHTLALFNEQTLEELVGQYVDKEHRRLMLESTQELQIAVGESEVTKTYTCHLCRLEVPFVFKSVHERGLRHLSCRTLAVAAAKRMRDHLRSADESADKSEDKSGDKSEDKSGDKSEDKAEDGSGDKPKDKSKDKLKMSGKKIKKLLKLYTGKLFDEDVVEDTEGDPDEPQVTKSKRLTTKQYFTDILPYMSFVSAFHTVIVDDTEFITIKIGRDTLKIHINNYNGINQYERHGMYYMNCILCDGYNASNVYSSAGQGVKKHVMCLGHIKNLLAPIDNVHLIRKIDEIHAVCALCNVYVSRQNIDNHILRDPNHTTALTEALERGKTYIDSKKHLKIMVCKPNEMQPHQWSFGIPQPQRQNSSVLFGGAQIQNGGNNAVRPYNAYGQVGTCFAQNKPGTGLFGAQNNTGFGMGFGSAQNNTAGFGSAQNGTTFGTQNNTGFGAPTSTGFGTFGSAQNNTAFGNAQNNTASFGSAQTNTAFGSAQNNTTFGSVQNNGVSVVSAQNNGAAFGSVRNNTGFGVPQNNTAFGSAQNNTTFGSVQNNGVSVVSAQNNGAAFGSVRNNTGFGVPQNNTTFGSAQTNTAFGTAQNNTGFGVPQNNTTFGSAQSSVAFDNKTQNARFGDHSIFKTTNKNIAEIQSVTAKAGGDVVSSATTKVGFDPSQPKQKSTNDKNNSTSGLTKQPEASEDDKLKSPSEKNVKFTFHSNDAGTVNKNGDDAPNGNATRDKPDVGNKQNNNKRNLIIESSSSSDSE